jgi:hypothetical protein
MHAAAADRDVSAALLARCRTFRRCRNAILDLDDSEAAADFYGETDLFLIDTYPAGPVAIGFVRDLSGRTRGVHLFGILTSPAHLAKHGLGAGWGLTRPSGMPSRPAFQGEKT